MRSIVLASSNKKKIAELRELLRHSDIGLIGLDSYPGIGEVVEDGHSFEANALIKARTVWRHTGKLVLADDSGLEVDALGGAPGIYSARYAGQGKDDVENYRKLLHELRDVPEARRTARFHCVLALAGPNSAGQYFEKTFDGKCEGRIAFEPKGAYGFGYDPVFFLPEYGCTSAELDPEIKNRISHRADAMRKFLQWMERLPTSSM
jgi:XTP/dITP diphosphohydrolase